MESLETAKTVVRIWEGYDMPGVGPFPFGTKSQKIQDVLSVMKSFIKVREKAGPCQGCFLGGALSGFYRGSKFYPLNTTHISGQGYLLPFPSPNLDRPPVKLGDHASEYDPRLEDELSGELK